MSCPNQGKKCECADCKAQAAIDKAQSAYKWNGVIPVENNQVERMFWVVTWRHTVEYLACRLFKDDKWIVVSYGGPINGVYGMVGVSLFDTEHEAIDALIKDRMVEEMRLRVWIDSLKAKSELLKSKR